MSYKYFWCLSYTKIDHSLPPSFITATIKKEKKLSKRPLILIDDNSFHRNELRI